MDQAKHLKNFHLLFRNGNKIHFNDGSTAIQVFAEIFSGKEYGHIKLKKDAIVVDIGANIGLFTAYIKNNYSDAAIYSFEPDPINFKCLSINHRFNRWKDVTIINRAISDQESEELSFFCHPIGGWSSLFNTHEDEMTEVKVESMKLSKFLKENDIEWIDLLKIDVEGGEYAILCNDINFEELPIQNLLVEVDKNPRDARFNYDDLISKLAPYYEITFLGPHSEFPTIHAKRI